MTAERKALVGVLPAVITPFDDHGQIEFDLFEKQVRYLRDQGVHGFYIAGTTAEGASVQPEERKQLVEIALETAPDRVICAVVIAPDTAAVLRGIDSIADTGVDYISAVSPFYFTTSQRDIVYHYEQIAEHSPVPLILYNIPQNTHNPIGFQAAMELSKHPNIVGIKDSAGDFGQFQRGLLAFQSDEFVWIQGEDLLDAPSYLIGGRCVVTGLANIWSEPFVQMFEAARRGDSEGVIGHQRSINSLARIVAETNGKGVPSIKEAVALLGRSTRYMKIRSMELCPEDRKIVASIIGAIGLT